MPVSQKKRWLIATRRMRRVVRALGMLNALAVVVLLSSGCQPTASIDRSVVVESLPEQEALERAMQSTPSVHAFRRVFADGPPHVYIFEGESRVVWGVLEAKADPERGNVIRLYKLWRRQPPASEARQTLALMDDVYAQLRAQIPELPPPSAMQERLERLPRGAR